MARATWKGFLRISLVAIPVKVFPATESGGALSFNQLHGICNTRLQQKRWCASCAREVPFSEIVKGHEFEPRRYVILDDADLDQVRPPSTRVIDLVQFTDADELDPMYVDRTYYLAPDGAAAAHAYAVMQRAMLGLVGIGKLAIYGREYLVATRALGRALVLHTLHHAGEIRTMDSVEELQSVPATVDSKQLALAMQILAAFEAPLDLATFTDDYRVGLQRVIDAKIAGEEIVAAAVPTLPATVNLQDALTQSLEAISRQKKRPAKALPKKRKRTRAA
jgi:DNA end-binding protein Ku